MGASLANLGQLPVAHLDFVHLLTQHLTIKFIINNQTVNDGVAHSKNPRKCAYHVTVDLDLDLEHTLDAR